MLDRGFSVAAGDADTNKPGNGQELSPCVPEVQFTDSLFDGPCQQTGQGNHQRQKQRPEEQQIPNDNGALEKPAQSRKHKRQHHHQPPHASSEDKGLFGVLFAENFADSDTGQHRHGQQPQRDQPDHYRRRRRFWGLEGMSIPCILQGKQNQTHSCGANAR